jgi:hypothetical protein
MRWSISLALALSVAACRQTIVLDQHIDGGGGGGADSGPASCSGPPQDFTPEFPEVIVALDRSLGMATRFGDSTVLAAARDAIDQHAMRYQNLIRFGYVEFPGAGNSCSPQPGCCASEVTSPGVYFGAFDMALHACDQNPAPSCSTAGYQRPTTATLYSCSLVFSRPPEKPRERYVLLVSNGWPDCGTNQNSGCMDAQNMADQLARNRVRTIVVAPGQLDPDTDDCLAGIAVRGGSDNPPYLHPASNPAELTTEIGDITRAMAKDACQLDLTKPIQDPDQAAVFWNNTTIPRHRSGTDGWELNLNGYEIILHGKWCDRLVDDGPGAFALFPNCDPQR